MTVSVVIPTYNRPEQLARLLRSVAEQTRRPDEIIVVDASEDTSTGRSIAARMTMRVDHLTAVPSVCHQRNIGIARATSEVVLLCDDDMELDKDYIASVGGYFEEHPGEVAVSGIVAERWSGVAFEDFPPLSAMRCAWNYVFGLSIWTDVRRTPVPSLLRPFFAPLRTLLLRRGNTMTVAGWPVVVDVRGPVFRTRFYGLGAAAMRRDFLLQHPFAEDLGRRGIGDNYGMALNIRTIGDIVVVTTTRARHFHSQEGRESEVESYTRRLHALIRFQKGDHGLTPARSLALLWSCLGNVIPYLLRRRWAHVRATLSAMRLIAGV